MFYLRFLALGLAANVLPAAAGVTDLWGHRHQAQGPIPLAGDCQVKPTNVKTNDLAVTPNDILRANRDGFFFENPETDCKYASQPYIYKSHLTLETDFPGTLFKVMHKDAHVQVVGHHPLAGIYHDTMHFFVNALRRLAVTQSEHQDLFRVKLIGIHGGCNEEWSVQEIQFFSRTNTGWDVDLVNVWVTRWSPEGQMIEVRTYVDSTITIQMLRDNEVWTNATSDTDRPDFEPGPAGMPDLAALEQLMPEKDRPQH